MDTIKKIILDQSTIDKLQEAINIIADGKCKRVDIAPEIKVYSCKDIIRIDIKNK